MKKEMFSEADRAQPDLQLCAEEIRRSSQGRQQKKRSLLVAACGWISCLFILAPLAQAQITHVPAACQSLQKELQGLKAERSDLQAELPKAGSGKAAIASQIKKLIPQIVAKEKELNKCAIAHGGKPDLAASFNGTATMTTNNPKVAGPFVQKVTINVVYLAWLHDQIRISNFPPISVGPFSTPIGDNTTTVTLVGAGGGGMANPTTGMIEVTLKLHFHHSLALAADSELVITLSTEAAGGSRLNSKGAITLVGTSNFQGGYLGGDSCRLVIKGTLLPLP
jgi:hypothetical protein